MCYPIFNVSQIWRLSSIEFPLRFESTPESFYGKFLVCHLKGGYLGYKKYMGGISGIYMYGIEETEDQVAEAEEKEAGGLSCTKLSKL